MSALLITVSALVNWTVVVPAVDMAACYAARPAMVKKYEADFPKAWDVDSYCVPGKVVMPLNAADRALLVNLDFSDNGKYTISPAKDKETCVNNGRELIKQTPNKWQMLFCWHGEVAAVDAR